MCSITSFTDTNRTYHRFYEVSNPQNIIDIKILTQFSLDINPVDNLIKVSTDLGNIQNILSDNGGIYMSSSKTSKFQKKIVLPPIFYYFVDINIPNTTEIISGGGNYPYVISIDDNIVIQCFNQDNYLTIAITCYNFKLNGSTIVRYLEQPISNINFNNDIRISGMVDCINKMIYLYYSFKEKNENYISTGRLQVGFDTYTPLALTVEMGNGYQYTSLKGDLRIKRFAIGYDSDAIFESMSRLGMPILMSQNFMSYDYTNNISFEGSSLSTHGTVRPSSPIIGQMFLDTTSGNGQPIWWNGSHWINSSGNVV